MKWRLIRTVVYVSLVGVIFYVCFLSPSVTAGVCIENNTDAKVTALVVDAGNGKVHHAVIEPGQTPRISVWSGESREQLEQKHFILVCVDSQGTVRICRRLSMNDFDWTTVIRVTEEDGS